MSSHLRPLNPKRRAAPRELNKQCQFHGLEVRRVANELNVTFHCAVDPRTAIGDAHARTVAVEQALRARLPNLGRVVIHVEPPETAQS